MGAHSGESKYSPERIPKPSLGFGVQMLNISALVKLLEKLASVEVLRDYASRCISVLAGMDRKDSGAPFG